MCSLIPRPFPPPVFDRLEMYLHTVSDQILEVGTAWERGYYMCIDTYCTCSLLSAHGISPQEGHMYNMRSITSTFPYRKCTSFGITSQLCAKLAASWCQDSFMFSASVCLLVCLCVCTYHVRNNDITYIVCMRLCFSLLHSCHNPMCWLAWSQNSASPTS